MRVVAVSDTHNQHSQLSLPMGDVLIHAGDALVAGDPDEYRSFLGWMHRQDFKHKIYVPGNHDRWVERNIPLVREEMKQAGVELLIDAPLTLEGKSFWGSPWVLPCGPWSFLKGEAEQARGLVGMPSGLDVLITHEAPFGVMDWVPGAGNLGAKSLLSRCLEQRPRHHVFGHIHEGGGQAELVDARGTITFHNVAQVGFGPTYLKLCAVPAAFDI